METKTKLLIPFRDITKTKKVKRTKRQSKSLEFDDIEDDDEIFDDEIFDEVDVDNMEYWAKKEFIEAEQERKQKESDYYAVGSGRMSLEEYLYKKRMEE